MESVSAIENLRESVFESDLNWCHLECVYNITNQSSELCFSTANVTIHSNCNLSSASNSTHNVLHCVDSPCPEFYNLGSWYIFMPQRLQKIFSLEELQPMNETFLVGNNTNRQNPALRCALETFGIYDYFALHEGVYCLASNDFHVYLRQKEMASKATVTAIELYTFNEETLDSWTPWVNWSSCSAACGNGTQQRWRYCFPNEDGRQNCTETNHFENRTCNADECPWNNTSYKHLGCRLKTGYESLFSVSMEAKDVLLDLPLEERLRAKDKCALVTLSFNRTIFAISDAAAMCLNSENEEETYSSYLNAMPSYDCFWDEPELSFDIYSLKDDIVDAQWGPWIWSACNKECGGGSQTIERFCNNPRQTDGADCAGISLATSSCNDHLCPTNSGTASIIGSINNLERLIGDLDTTWNEEEVKDYIVNVMSEASQILDVNNTAGWQQMDDAEVIHVIELLEQFAVDLIAVTDPGTTYHFQEDNLELFVAVHTLTSEMKITGLHATPQVYLPPNIFQQLDSTAGREFGVATLSYNNLDKWIEPTSYNKEPENPEYFVIDSKILSVLTDPPIGSVFSEVDIVLKALRLDRKEKEDGGVSLCSFIDGSQTSISDGDLWSQVGCHVLNSSVQYTYCQCNHLTAFGVLLRVSDVQIEEVHQKALTWITYVCCILSLSCLLVAFVLFILLNNLGDQIIIHRNLIASLFSAQLLFVTAINATSNAIVCKIVAICLHFLYTASFCWMLVEGIHLYFKVVSVFINSNTNRLLRYYSVFGWGMPVIIVATSVGISLDGYGTDDYCWLAVDMIWAFVGPVLFVIVINTCIMILVIRIIVQASTNLPGTKTSDLTKVKSGVKGMVILLPILGLTWVFGIFSFNSSLIAFEYIFGILNGLQGVFIFLFYCVFNSEVRSALKLKRMQMKSKGISPSVNKSQVSKDNDDSVIVEDKLVPNLFVLASRDINPPTSSNDASMEIEDVEYSHYETEPEEIKYESPIVTDDPSASTSTLNQSHNSNQSVATQITCISSDSLNNQENPFKKQPKLFKKKPWKS